MTSYDIKEAKFHADFPPKELVDNCDAKAGSNDWNARQLDNKAIANWFRENAPEIKPDESMTTREKELYLFNCTDYVDNFKQGKVTCTEYVTALVKRIKHYQKLNAFLVTTYDETDLMIKQANAIDEKVKQNGVESVSPLYGLPVAMKGTAASIDFRSGCGTGVLSEYKATEDAEMIKLLKSRNAVIMGLTNVPEFACSWITMNHTNGVTRNPHNTKFSPGGSSGGSGCAVAARLVPLSVSEDTGGSTRHPASMNGIFGYDPLRNHFPNGGNPGLTYFNDQIGLHCRTVSDLLFADAAINSTEGRHKEAEAATSSVKVGFPKEFFQEFNFPEAVTENPFGLASHRADDHIISAINSIQKVLSEDDNFTTSSANFKEVESKVLGGKVNVLYDMHFGININGRSFDPIMAGCHSLAGNMAQWVSKYFDVMGVGVRDLVGDVRATGLSHNPKAFMGVSNISDETQSRYIPVAANKFREVWNEYFDTNNIDIIITPTQTSTSQDISDLIEGCCPVNVKQSDGSYKIQNTAAVSTFNYTIQCQLKHLPIPKLQIPVGKDPSGRTIGVTLWGRSVPTEDLMYDDAAAKVLDIDFLHKAKKVVEAIQKSKIPTRLEPDLNKDLF
eukprot:TRINITY_DN24396_c0_g1_i1.p1 TRINITY_DN24396_c0_g1~~TRINITY_DN24396_c0_g1_i1.p1  ORF type:complete len:617 (+),score=135.96 TRINITY_DN24396_c0_g1_i1:54-1904(+)